MYRYLFVAVLPCSCYTYAEACEDMKTENWLSCHVHAFHYFGGVTRLLIPDNCKTATTANTRYETMDSHHPMERNRETDHGRNPFVVNIPRAARHNQNFRSALWTGHHLQMTLMCIPVCGDIGVEVHPNTDQFIRVESGEALVRMGPCRENLDISHHLSAGDGVFVPCGTWHNIFNTGNCPLMLSSIYAPPQHPKGTVHHTKADTEHEEH